MTCKCSSTGLRWLWVTVVVLIIDRVTKTLAQKYLVLNTALPVVKFFNLTLTYNTGAAFSFLDTASGWQGWLFGAIATLVSVFVLAWLSKLPKTQRWLGVALALILAGALGNLWDRFIYGHVVDFIEWYVSSLHWPVFNIADSAICIGAVMLFWDALTRKKQ